jgi:ribosome-associated protein
MDGMECTGDFLSSPAARSDIRHPPARAGPQLAPPFREPEASGPVVIGAILANPSSTTDQTKQPIDVEALHALIMQSLDDDQAVELISIPLAGKSSIADHMVIASGKSSRQVASMATKLADKIKQQFGKIVRVEGLPTADWVLVDADDVIIHLFRPEVRTFYNLERMWAFGDEQAKTATP